MELIKFKPSVAGLRAALKRHGGSLPELDGQYMERFSPAAFVTALEAEIRRSLQEGLPKISIHMDIKDAALMVEYMRRR